MLYRAKKVVIITEKLITEDIIKLIEKADASGYTISSVGGKGSRDIRPTSDRASIVQDFDNIKFEIIVQDAQQAHAIIEDVVKQYLKNYSGIAFVEDVEVVRPEKFHH